MSRRSLPLLLLLGLLAAAFLYFAGSDPASEAPLEEEALGAGTEEVLEEAPSTAEELPTLAADTTVERVEAPVETAPPEPAAFVVPDDSIWVEGRVVLPPETPVGEVVRVEARGRRFGKAKGNPREMVVEVDPSGNFRVPFSESTRKGWLKLEARYLYLSSRVKVEPKKQEGPVVLEPRLGGRILGRVLAPHGLQPDAETFEGARASLFAWNGGDGRQVQRNARIAADGTFHLDAVPAGSEYDIRIESSRWAGASLKDQIVRRGEDTRVELTFSAGARISGSIVDGAGRPVKKASLELELTTLTNGNRTTHMRPVPLDVESAFDLRGLQPGSATLTARAEGLSEVVLDLGKLEDGDERLGLLLTPNTGSFLAGTVHWPDGSPAAGATVKIKQASEDGLFDWEARDFLSETDGQGAFRVEGLDDRPLIVEASARRAAEEDTPAGERRKRPRLTQRTEEVQPGTAGLVLTLSEGLDITGRVLDDRGQPLTSFLVEAKPVREDQDLLRAWEGLKSRSFRDEAGVFELSGLSEGIWQLRASEREGSEGAWVEAQLPGSAPVELVVPRGATLSGVVRTPTGELVPDARVEIEPVRDHRAGSWLLNPDESRTTGETGAFEFEGVTPGKYELHAEAEGWGSSELVLLQLDPGAEVTGQTLSLRTGGRITGIVHPNASPVAGRQISVRGETLSRQTRSDASGAFEVEGVPPGEITVRLYPPNSDEELSSAQRDVLSDRVKVEVPEAGSVHVVLGGPPEDPIRVFGRVTHGGEPAAGLTVQSRSPGHKDLVTTDANGNYQLEVEGPGRHSFSVTGESSRFDLRREITGPEEQRLDIELPAASLAGIVLGPDGDPLEGVDLTLTLVEGESEEHRSKTRKGATRSDGTFELRFLHPGEHSLQVGQSDWWLQGADGGYAIKRIDAVHLEEGEQRTDLRIRLEPAGRVSGVVSHPDGSPAIGAQIYAKDAKGRELSGWGVAVTDETGRFTARRMPAEKLSVRAWLSDGLESESVTVHVTAGATAEVELHLKD